MLDILTLLTTLLDFLRGLHRPARALLLQPLITVVLLLSLYAGWHVQDEGDLVRGLRVAFLDTRAGRAERDRDVELAIQRAELYQAAQSNKLVDQLMTTLLQHAAFAARVRLGVIHNGVTGVTGIGLLRFDVTNAVSAPGHTPGAVMQNQPLSEWSAILPDLLAGRCDLSDVNQMVNLASRARLQAMGAAVVLACPVTDVHGAMLGALFTVWDVGDAPPAGQELILAKQYARRIGGQIAAALDLLVPTPRLGHLPVARVP